MATRLEEVAEAVHDTLNDSTVKRQHGRNALAENAQRRRIVWVRAASTIDGNTPKGGKQVGNESGARHVAVYTRVEAVELHIFAETEALAELLLDNVLAALHITCGPSAQPSAYEWETERQGTADIALRQPKIRLDVAFRMPVSDEIAQLVPATSQDHTGIWIGALGEEVVC